MLIVQFTHRDPVVAKRVRVLHVYPGFLNQVLDIDSGDCCGKEFPLVRRSLRLRLAELANHILEQKMFIKHNKYRLVQTFRTARDVVKVMLDVFASLPNVTDYHIMWCGLQAAPESPVPFLAAVFHANLRKLSLEISLENVEGLFSPHSSIPHLEELDLTLRIDHFRVASPGHNLVLINHLAPAITRFRSSLQKLSIQSWEPLDLSPLFRAIYHLPLLDHLTLAVPIDAPHFGDPSGLTDLLRRQRVTLRSLSLRATQYNGAGLTPDPTLIDAWIREALADAHLPNLRELDISSSLFPLRTSMYCLRKFAETITSLVLTGCYLRYPDVAIILREWTYQQLESLRLGSVTLTPKLVDLFAKTLPDLYRLELLVREVVPSVSGHLVETGRKVYVESEIVSVFCLSSRAITDVGDRTTFSAKWRPASTHNGNFDIWPSF